MRNTTGGCHVRFIWLDCIIQYDESFLFESHEDLSIVLFWDTWFGYEYIAIRIPKLRRGLALKLTHIKIHLTCHDNGYDVLTVTDVKRRETDICDGKK